MSQSEPYERGVRDGLRIALGGLLITMIAALQFSAEGLDLRLWASHGNQVNWFIGWLLNLLLKPAPG